MKLSEIQIGDWLETDFNPDFVYHVLGFINKKVRYSAYDRKTGKYGSTFETGVSPIWFMRKTEKPEIVIQREQDKEDADYLMEKRNAIYERGQHNG